MPRVFKPDLFYGKPPLSGKNPDKTKTESVKPSLLSKLKALFNTSLADLLLQVPTKEVHDNCYACAVSSTWDFVAASGLSCLRVKCSHVSDRRNFQVYASRYFFVWITCIFLSQVVGACWHAYAFLRASRAGDDIGMSVSSTSFCCCFRAAVHVFIFNRGINVIGSTVKNMQGLIDAWGAIIHDVPLDRDRVKAVRVTCNFRLASIFLVFITYIFYVFVLNFVPDLMLARKALDAVCLLLDLVVVVFTLNIVTLILSIIDKFEENIRGHLRQFSEIVDSEASLEALLGAKKTLLEALAWGRRRHACYFFLYTRWNNYMEVAQVIWHVSSIITLTLHIFILFLTGLSAVAGRPFPLTPDFFAAQYYLAIVSLYISYGVFLVATMGNVTDNVRSLVYKYPISKLGPAEAQQVEMLITTLKIQHLIPKVSDFFSVKPYIFPAIGEAIIAHILVALQFHASWNKN